MKKDAAKDAERLAAHLPWTVALAAVPFLLRGLRIAGDLGLQDVRGFLSDALFAWIWLMLLRPFLGRPWVAALGAGLWAAMHVGVYEHLDALGALPRAEQLGYLFDPVFFRGSVLPVLARPFTWILLAGAVGGAVAARRAGLPARLRKGLLGPAAAALVLLLWPVSSELPSWRQAHVLELAGRHGAATLLSDAAPDDGPGQTAGSLDPADLSGEPRRPADPGRNVVLVVVEGISGGYFPSILEAAGLGGLPGLMPRTDRFLQDHGLLYRRFVNLQRQTNRGTYGLLCGRPPRLDGGLPKMTELARSEGGEGHDGGSTLDCLPRRLARAGYRTVYLQAAPLPFMLKDRFMPRAGFEQVRGAESFERARERGEWGVDDHTLFDRAFDAVDELRRADRPFFLTVLTVGTHHPFTVPDDHGGPYPQGSFPWAVDFLDSVLAPFLSRLVDSGVLDDTVVIVTSDEAVGLAQARGDFTQMVSQAWGFLGVTGPGIDPGPVDETFLQTDLPLSVLDHLAVLDPDDSAPFTGRSVFRTYEKPRAFAFGNVYLDRVAGLTPDGRLVGCRVGLRDCVRLRLEDGNLFSPRRTPEPFTEEDATFLSARVEAARPARTEAGNEPTGPGSAHGYRLVRTSRVPLGGGAKQWIFGGQSFSVPPGSRVEVDLEVTYAASTGSAAVKLHHDLAVDGRPPFYLQQIDLAPGESARFRYRYRAGEEGIERLECRLWAVDPPSAGALVLGDAVLRVVGAEGVGSAGLTLDAFELRHAPDGQNAPDP